jgi:hypothetical protein
MLDRGVYLDLLLTLRDDHIDYAVYQKPINKYQYIPPQSAHNRSVFVNWVVAELKRYDSHSRSDAAYHTITMQFASRLRARGYSAELIALAWRKAPARTNHPPNPNPNLGPPAHAHTPPPARLPKRNGPIVITLRMPLLSPKPQWKSLLALPPEITTLPKYVSAYGDKNVMIGHSNHPNVGQHITKSLFVSPVTPPAP